MSENKQQNALKEKQADVRMETKVCKETPSQNLNFEGIHKEDLKRPKLPTFGRRLYDESL